MISPSTAGKRMVDAFRKIKPAIKDFFSLLRSFFSFTLYYLKENIVNWSSRFERNKNVLVRFFMMKRGRYNRPFLHIATMCVVGLGVLIAPFLADTYPIFSPSQEVHIAVAEASEESVLVDEDVFKTNISQKPRDEAITYRVEKGDTVSTIADKFGVSADTVRWANNLTTDNITVEDELKILPVSGVSHKVVKGETIYTIAKKYDTEAQKIADFPFNDFANPETFSLVEGTILTVPDGIKPTDKPAIRRQVYIAEGPIPSRPGGFTFPMRGYISQFAAWYHMGIDIAGPFGTPIYAAHNGTVTKISTGTWDGGYGNNVYISNGDGIESHYAHLNAVNVSVGQSVVGGQTVIGTNGLTGRTTGAHVHFEIIRNGALVNPLPYVQ
jgi:murein DD-endopeptidase MepM/ murein hydrolase activator NlpD